MTLIKTSRSRCHESQIKGRTPLGRERGKQSWRLIVDCETSGCPLSDISPRLAITPPEKRCGVGGHPVRIGRRVPSDCGAVVAGFHVRPRLGLYPAEFYSTRRASGERNLSVIARLPAKRANVAEVTPTSGSTMNASLPAIAPHTPGSHDRSTSSSRPTKTNSSLPPQPGKLQLLAPLPVPQTRMIVLAARKSRQIAINRGKVV
jgi:hypothetical protein